MFGISIGNNGSFIPVCKQFLICLSPLPSQVICNKHCVAWEITLFLGM